MAGGTVEELERATDLARLRRSWRWWRPVEANQGNPSSRY